MSTTDLYCCIDDFAKIYADWENHHLIPTGRQRNRQGKLNLSESLFIMVLFHLSPFKTFKDFWIYGVGQKYRNCFGDLPSYGRFVACKPRLFMPLCMLLQSLGGQETGIYIVDSTKLAVCHTQRISRNRVFKGVAAHGRSSMGWFYGFKLHLVMNNLGEIMAVKITPGNVDDRAPLAEMARGLQGMQNLIRNAGHTLLYLPPYSPDLNPIEQKWAQTKAIRKQLMCSINELFKIESFYLT